jgi:subtilase family serine protease
VKSKVLCLLFGSIALPVVAQVPANPLVTEPIDASRLVAIHGTVHPLAQARYDRGPVNESTPAARLLLVLNRPPEREAAFQQLLKNLHTPGSSSYHHWLTPEQIGSQFGPADSDIEAVAGWLSSSGFTVSRVSQARRFVEFSGTVGQVNSAFHTEIREYMVDGVAHHANATELSIPSALASIVATVSPLDDFRPTPQYHSAGQAHYDGAARNFQPDYNLPPSWTPLLYGVAPADFYTEYDLNPLYSASINGAGKTIGIIDESNIDLGVVNAYRSVFGLTSSLAQVVLDGGDPGQNSSIVESYLDVELAGAIAPAATVNLYISAGSPYQDPLSLAALRAVEDNQADVISISWGAAEQELENSGNQFWNALWEQAAAQGQTVVVAAGDYGQVPNEAYFFTSGLVGPSVSGLASTPWNIAAGGTDFYYADYASGAPSASTFWNATNDPVTKGSLKARLPEQVWNDPFGLDAISNGLERGEIVAGGGGASNCSTSTNLTNPCVSGYAKPAWQSGPGVPTDGVRDIPDVSLFASNGANYSGFAICDYEGSCTPDANGNFGVEIVGGTSASAPSMAAIMALVDQKFGRQGQADTVLYPLALQKPAAFHDITLGGNWDICVQGDSDCTLNVDDLGAYEGESTVYSATPGFDLASGLGSVDASQLVNNWSAISFASTSTTLQVTPAKAVHGTSVTIAANVAPSSGSGTPTGAVSILTSSALPSNASQTAIALSGGSGSASVDTLPGGTYQVTAQYSGDATYASSTSAPETLTITPETSTLSLNISALNIQTAGVTYGEPITFTAQPSGVNSSNTVGTGTVAFTLDSTAATIPLNVGGMASWISPAPSVGTHTINASYSGDASFNPSSAKPATFSVTAGVPSVNMNIMAPPESTGPGYDIAPGGSITLSAEVGPQYGVLSGSTTPVGTLAPTGTVTICLTENFNVGGNVCPNPTYSQTVSLISPSGIYSQYSTATVTFSNLAAGSYIPEFQYNGDANWEPFGLFYLTYIIVQPFTPLAASTTTLSISTNSITQSQGATLTTTVAGSGSAGVAPTGVVVFYNNGNEFTYAYLPTSSTNSTTVSFAILPSELWNNGSNQITAVYYGDQNYQGSTSNVLNVTAAQTAIGDFSIAPQSPQITVQSGAVGSAGVNLTSINGFDASVALTCTPSSSQFSCSVTPASPALNGTVTATLTVNATIPGTTAKLIPGPWRQRGTWTRAATVLAACLVFVLPWRRRRVFLPLCLVVLSAVMISCGGSGGGTTTQPPPANGTPAGTYNVLLTGTANGTIHTAKVTVLVQ